MGTMEQNERDYYARQRLNYLTKRIRDVFDSEYLDVFHSIKELEDSYRQLSSPAPYPTGSFDAEVLYEKHLITRAAIATKAGILSAKGLQPERAVSLKMPSTPEMDAAINGGISAYILFFELQCTPWGVAVYTNCFKNSQENPRACHELN